jgi:hypothetical protein
MIFTLRDDNIAFLKNPTMEKCKERIGDAPYWTIHGRICYHNHVEPTYIIHNAIPVEAEKEWYKDFVHVYPDKKTLYAMSHYALNELKELAEKLGVSTEGKKKDIYERIQNEFKPFLTSTMNGM